MLICSEDEASGLQLLPELVDRVTVTAFDVATATEGELAALLDGVDAVVYADGPDHTVRCEPPASEFFQRELVDATTKFARAAAAAGVKRFAIAGSAFATWDRMTGDGFAQRHPYVRACVDQSARAMEIGVAAGMGVCVVEIPYVFGAVPGVEPMWKSWIFDRLLTMRKVVAPNGGTSVVTAANAGAALGRAALFGVPGARYPISDEDLTWKQMLGVLLPLLGMNPHVTTLSRRVMEPAVWFMWQSLTRRGVEPGVAPSHVLRDIMSVEMFVDPRDAQRDLGFQRGRVAGAMAETVKAAYGQVGTRPDR